MQLRLPVFRYTTPTMPKRKRTYSRKKRSFKRRRFRRATRTIGRSLRLGAKNAPLPKKLKSKFIYTTALYNIASSGPAPVTHVFSLNGLYDPEVATGGNQPRGFDQLMLLYDHYVVIGVKARIDFTNASTTNPVYCYAAVRDSASVSTNYRDYMEDAKTKWKILDTEGSGRGVNSMNMVCNPNKFLGRSKPMADPDLKGDVTTNPTEQAYLHVGGLCTDLFTASNINAVVTLEYTAVLIEPKQVVAS